MTLVGLVWADGAGGDIHLLPGLASPRLNQLLFATDRDPVTGVLLNKAPSAMAGLTLAFKAKFDGAPGPKHGVTMDAATGEVKVASPLPAGPRLRSFLVTVTATQGTSTATERVRVYVHGVIFRMWLTPSSLTVRKGARNTRLTVLARFDGGFVCDISNWSPPTPVTGPNDVRHVRPVNSNAPVLSWSSSSVPPGIATRVPVHAVTGVLDAVADTGASMITVTGGGQTASALAVCSKPWATPVRTTLVAGPGVDAMDEVPNILFLPDGFTGPEQTAYETLVRGTVVRLSTRRRTRPFKHLSPRMNYFMAWLPSHDAGVSVLNEVYEAPVQIVGQPVQVDEVELPSVSPPANWELPDLIHEVGLPAPAYDPFATQLADEIARWQPVYGPHIRQDKMSHLYVDWLMRGTRMLLNERDTALHMAFGDRPRLSVDSPPHGLHFHRYRLDGVDFNAFLDALQGPDGQALPKVWTTGKDNALVVILCRSQRVGGLQGIRPSRVANVPGRALGVSANDGPYHRVRAVAGGDGFDVEPDPIPAEVNQAIWLTIAHELAHSWTLDDEYGGSTSPITAVDEADIAACANVQARGTLLSGGNLVADNIRWGKWPRIAKAGVLKTRISHAGGRFSLTLVSHPVPRFVKGDVVRLRTRPLPKSTGHSGRFRVDDVNGDDLVIVPLPGTIVDPATLPNLFPPRGPGVPGSILMAPARAPDPDPATNKFGDDLSMVTDAVRQRINLTHNPLNAEPLAGESPAPNDAVGRPCANVDLPGPTTPATNFPARKAPSPPRYPSWTIGLYENGARHNCGVYRPTGVCIMHTKSQVDATHFNLYDFCLVCRYALVDAIDPTVHGQVNEDYRQRYEVGAP